MTERCQCGGKMHRVEVVEVEAGIVDNDEGEAKIEIEAAGAHDVWRCEKCENEKPTSPE